MTATSVPTDWVESISRLSLPPKANYRFQDLMGRNTSGALNETEKAELEALMEVAEALSELRSEAMYHLGVKPV